MLIKQLKILILALLFALVFIVLISLLPAAKSEEIVPKEKKHSDKGIYITYHVAKTQGMLNNILRQAKQVGINTIVVDSKWFLEGPILELLKQKKITKDYRPEVNEDFALLVKNFHDQGFIVSARLVVFKDDRLVLSRKDLGVRLGNDIYRDHKGGKWADPYSEEVRLYNELIAESAALSGVDEVQFDYIRFPAEGKAVDAVFPHEIADVSRIDIICSYLEAVQKRLKKYNVSIAVDIFGVTAWQSNKDNQTLGQDVKRMAPYIDVLSPMLYPSHFHQGYDGFANPGSEPYYFMSQGVKKTKELLSNEAVAVVPWLQGFNMSSPN
ncbi:MAG: putative glycoside hydrolase, partial [bacterium]